jgi:hypothetical protein
LSKEDSEKNIEYENGLFERSLESLKITTSKLDNEETFDKVFKEMERLRIEDQPKC